jgi:hypothetical protein
VISQSDAAKAAKIDLGTVTLTSQVVPSRRRAGSGDVGRRRRAETVEAGDTRHVQVTSTNIEGRTPCSARSPSPLRAPASSSTTR